MDMIPMGKKIYHRNDVRVPLMDMSLPARRLLYLCLARFDRYSSKGKVEIFFDSNKVFEITVKEYAYLCGKIDYSVAYRQMRQGVRDLRAHLLEPPAGYLHKKNPNLPVDWIEPFTIAERGTGYSKGEGFVQIKFAEEMSPLFSGLTQSFTGQLLSSALSISDSNASKLYLLLREWIGENKWSNERIIDIDDLKSQLGVSDFTTYDLYNNFRSQFFLRAAKKLANKTEFIKIEMDIHERKARKASKVKISWQIDESKQAIEPTKEEMKPTGKITELPDEVWIQDTLFTREQVELEGYDWEKVLDEYGKNKR